MFVKKNSAGKGRILLTYTHGYRNHEGKTKHVNVETIGYLDELEKTYDNPIQHFKDQIIVKFKNFNFEEFLDEKNKIEFIKVSMNQKISDPENTGRKNLGYFCLNSIYNSLNISKVFKDYQKNRNFDYDINDVMELLVFSRILFPASKQESYDNKDHFFNKWDFSKKDMYRSLESIASLKDSIIKQLWDNSQIKYNRDSSTSYYDCTNYYFEILYNDDDIIDEDGNVLEKGLRKKDPSKEHRKTPCVGMGLFLDNNNIPLTYALYPGNESEKPTLRPLLKKMKKDFNINRTVVVADRGLNTSDNTFFLSGNNDVLNKNYDGYIYGQSIKQADKKFKEWVLDQSDYILDKKIDTTTNETLIYFKHKSRLRSKDIKIKDENDKRCKNTTLYQKQMVYYSAKYAAKQKHDRNKAIEKAKDLIKNPAKYNKSTSYGATNYINNLSFNKDTGEVIKKQLSLKTAKIEEEEKYDGYYAIVTSELELSDIEIRDRYKNLWKIEDSFKITKSQIKSRPVYVWTEESIEAHFLTCFVSLVILRLLEIDLEHKYSIRNIINSLGKMEGSKIKKDYYLLDYWDDVIKDAGIKYGIDWDKKVIDTMFIKNTYLTIKNA
jgi:transposase